MNIWYDLSHWNTIIKLVLNNLIKSEKIYEFLFKIGVNRAPNIFIFYFYLYWFIYLFILIIII